MCGLGLGPGEDVEEPLLFWRGAGAGDVVFARRAPHDSLLRACRTARPPRRRRAAGGADPEPSEPEGVTPDTCAVARSWWRRAPCWRSWPNLGLLQGTGLGVALGTLPNPNPGPYNPGP